MSLALPNVLLVGTHNKPDGKNSTPLSDLDSLSGAQKARMPQGSPPPERY